MNELNSKFKEVILSILPITVIVLILNFTVISLQPTVLARFLIGVVLIGNFIGASMAKTNKLWTVAILGLLLGFFVSIAEPDLHILASQVAFVTAGTVSKWTIVIIVSIGIAVMLAIGFIRIVYNFPLYKLLTICYGVIFVLALFTSREFLAIAFDASGATTGALTVPFILALAMGVSRLKKNSKASEKDSFGLVAIASVGAILAVMLLSIGSGADEISASMVYDETKSASVLQPFLHEIPKVTVEIFWALVPILIIFLLFYKLSPKLSRKQVRKILYGILFTFIGMILFLVGVNSGFMDVGSKIGYQLASRDNKFLLIVVGFILGVVTILAEPAVYVLTHQIEEVTSGYVKRRAVMVTLSIGVGIAVVLSVIRVLMPKLQLWHYILPGYIICIVLSFIVPKLFVGMAFDSGGVASGPMTATFILAYIQGAADSIEYADVLIDGFGMIAMVAMTPIIALQIMGLVFKIKSRKKVE